MRYLWELSPAGSIHEDSYYTYSDSCRLDVVDKGSVPKFKPYEVYRVERKNFTYFDENEVYPIQNGFVFDTQIRGYNGIKSIAFENDSKLVAIINNQKIIIDEKTNIKAMRFINFCKIVIESDKVYKFKYFFPFYYLLLHDGMQNADECSPLFYLMKQWQDTENRMLWINSWKTGHFTDRWIK